MLIRLSAPTGEIADDQAKPGDSLDRIVRSAILIHSGPGGESVDLSASNGDISFDEERIKSVVKSHNEMISSMAVDYGGFDKVPTGAYPPVLDQHNDDSNDRIRGRLTGLLRFERRDVPKVGKDVACAISDITFLGNDTVSKVKNGLIYHLSVGINEDSDTLGEVSCVIEPAAPGAMVLKKGVKKLGLFKDAASYKSCVIKVGEGTNGQIAFQIFKQGEGHVMNSGPKFNSEAEAVASAKRYIDEKKLKGAKVSRNALAKLKKLSVDLNKLSTVAKEQKEKVNLAKRTAEVKSKFVKLMADKKMTPAEFKKVDLTRLSKLDPQSLETIMHVYDAREAQVKSGQQGTVSASVFTDVSAADMEASEVKRFKLAARKNLSKAGVKFKADEQEQGKPDLKLGTALSNVNLEDSVDGEVEDQDDVQGQEEMMQQIEENATQIARVASALEEVISRIDDQDQKDAVDEEADKAEAKAEAEDEKDEEKKDLSDDDKKEDDKTDLASEDKKEDDKEESK